MTISFPKILLLALAVLIGLSGCAPALPEPTLVPTVAVIIETQQPTPPEAGLPTAYPAVVEEFSPEATTYPVGEGDNPGPSGVPARPNLSVMEARLVESAPSEQDPASTRLRVQVLAVSLVNGGDFASNLVNQEVDLFVQGQSIPDLQPGDTFRAEVTYLGDESGGNFFVTRFITE